ncbi:MAG: hypothetical protein U0528_16360 [Anaerolineae bacterium]
MTDRWTSWSCVADTTGLHVAGRAIQNLKQIDPATYIGSGKVLEIREEIRRGWTPAW